MSDRRWGLLALLGSIAVTSLLYAGGSLLHLDRVCIPRCEMDTNLYVWMFGWMQHALATGQNPFVASAIGAPYGTPLYWVTSVPAQAFIASPMTWLLGAQTSYNLMVILGVASAAWAVTLLCYDVVERRAAALMGGALFWASSYLTWEAVHMNLLFVAPLVLFARLVIRYAKGSIGIRRLGIAGGLLLAVQFYASTETFASFALFGAIAVGLYLMLDVVSDRRVVAVRLGRGIAAAYGVCLPLIAPFIWRALQISTEPARVLTAKSVDLLEIIVPSETSLLGVWAGGLRRLVGIESGYAKSGVAGYLGLPIMLLVIWFWRNRSRFPKMLAPFVASVMVLSLGPEIELFRRLTIPGPYALLAGLPFLEHALPKRYPLYAWITISVMLALWLAVRREEQEDRRRIVLWSLIGGLVLFPGAQVLAPPDPLPSAALRPAFFVSSQYRWFIEPDDVVLALTDRSIELRWQLASGFGFVLSEGYLGPYAPWAEGVAVSLPPDDPALLAGLSAARHLDWIAMPSDSGVQWRSTLEAFSGRPPIVLGGIDLYHVPDGTNDGVAPPSTLAQAAYRRATAEALQGAFTEAAREFRQVLALRPTNPFAHMGLARLYIDYGSEALAEVHLRAALAANPDFIEPMVALARLWSADGRETYADALYRRVFLLRPSALTDAERLRATQSIAGTLPTATP